MESARIATFNVRHGLGRDDRIDLRRTAAAILEAAPDLLALQEVDRLFARSNRVDQPAMLQELTGLEVTLWPTLKRAGGEFGLAVAAREPLESWYRDLPRREPDEHQRGVIVARWAHLTLVATHLSLRERSRAVQIEALAELATSLDGPVVVAGDLNETREGLGPLLEAGFDPGPPADPTLPAWWGGRQVDFVLAGPGLRISNTAVVPGDASDHRLLVASVETR